MHKFLSLPPLASSLFFACGSSAQDVAKPVKSAGPLTGRWVVNADFLVLRFISGCYWINKAKS